MNAHFFQHPEPLRHTRVRPVFLPFAGCPDKCVYCAQNLQTATASDTPRTLLQNLRKQLETEAARNAPPMELAFYGGTFTRLPQHHQHAFLELAQRYRELGLVTKIRCSTRPDAVTAQQLQDLRQRGLDMVELGIQSFDDTTLTQSQRGYTAATALKACEIVHKSNLELGVQLLPALPGMTPRAFLQDIETTIRTQPATARIYPCQVINNTPLATLYQQGLYKPWSLSKTTQLVALALTRLWKHHIAAIRIGLAPEPELIRNTLAGANHPALGARARAYALHHIIRTHVAYLGHAPTRLDVPRKYQGEFWGHKNELARNYQHIGLNKTNVHTWNLPLFRIG